MGSSRTAASSSVSAAPAAAPTHKSSDEGWGDNDDAWEGLDAASAPKPLSSRPSAAAATGPRRPMGVRAAGTGAAGGAAARKPGGGMKLGAAKLAAAKLQQDDDFSNW